MPLRQFEQSPHRHGLTLLEVQDFVMPATVALIRSATPGRFDPAIGLLTSELQAKLGTTAEQA